MAEKEAPPAETTGPTAAEADPAPEEPTFKPYEPKKGWVEDTRGRFHEVEDQDLYLQAYPGSKAVKAGDVVKSRVGYPKADAKD